MVQNLKQIEGIFKLFSHASIYRETMVNSQQTNARQAVIGQGHTINNQLSGQPPVSDAEKMTLGLINANPVVHAKKERVARTEDLHGDDAVDPLEIYDFVRDIRDPEHPYSLEQLSVLSEESITVDEKLGRILITFTPTIQHCSMATVIGLCLRVKLKHCFPPHFKVDIKVSPGSHANEESVNKQLNDKERVAAALENPNLRQLVDECLYSNEL